MEEIEVVHIIAGNYKEFTDYVKTKDTILCKYQYVSDWKNLVGLSKVKGFYIGTASKRPDIEQLKSMIYIIKCKNEIINNTESFRNE